MEHKTVSFSHLNVGTLAYRAIVCKMPVRKLCTKCGGAKNAEVFGQKIHCSVCDKNGLQEDYGNTYILREVEQICITGWAYQESSEKDRPNNPFRRHGVSYTYYKVEGKDRTIYTTPANLVFSTFDEAMEAANSTNL